MKIYRGINQLNYKTLNNANYFIQRVALLIRYLKKKKRNKVSLPTSSERNSTNLSYIECEF